MSTISVVDYVEGVKSPLTSRECLLFYPDSPAPDLGPYAIRWGEREKPVKTI